MSGRERSERGGGAGDGWPKARVGREGVRPGGSVRESRGMKARALLLAACAALACARAPEPEPWAADVAARNREADRRLDEGDPAGARAALTALVAAEGPRAAASDERRLAVQDAYFRLAQLALGEHDARQALADADAGLALGDRRDLFAANLLVARGAAHEALDDHRAAADDYERALAINEALLREAVPR